MVSNIINSLKGLLGGGQAQQSEVVAGYPGMLTVVDGDANYNTAALVGAITALILAGGRGRIWEMTVPAQMQYRWGFGHPALAANQGYLWFGACDLTTAWHNGVVHLAYENHSRHAYIPIADIEDTMLHSQGATYTAALRPLIDKNQMQALPEGGSKGDPTLVGQDSRLVIDYTSKITLAGADDCDFNIPVT